MPYKPKTPCAHPGCPSLSSGRYCSKHAKAEAKQYNKYDRDPLAHKRYGRRWRQIRTAFLAAHPLCEQCTADGRLSAATTVHHKHALSDGGTHDTDNLMALCNQCHSRLHAKQGDYF